MILNMDSSVYSLMSSIVLEDKNGNPYCYLANAERKEWLIDARSWKTLKMGLHIYEPTSVQGKLIKSMLPFLFPILKLQNKVVVKELKAEMNSPFTEVITQAFSEPTKKLSLSFFLGTPSVHQKIVCQVSRENHLLGYIKITDNPKVAFSFYKETELLKWLKAKRVPCIPEPLLCEKLSEGSQVTVFVQSTDKNRYSQSFSEIDEVVFDFLGTFVQKTREECLFDESDYYRVIQSIEENAIYYPGDTAMLLSEVRKVADQYKGKNCSFAACHGDFTPWNTYRNIDADSKQRLYAFDFEYAIKTGPIMMDAYHWLTSVGIFQKHNTGMDIITEVGTKMDLLRKYDPTPMQTLKLYLLYQIGLYLERDKGKKSGQVLNSFMVWDEMLGIIIKERNS